MNIPKLFPTTTMWTLLLGISLFITGCAKEDNSDSNAPDLPPLASMLVDTFPAHPDAQAASIGTRAAASIGIQAIDQNASYFSYAAFNVAVWNTIIRVGLAVPVASFVESFHHKPALQDDGTWIWSYNVTVGAVKYTAKLHGKIVDANVNWAMYISKAGEYTDFNWYSGTSHLSGDHGNWTLMNSPANPEPLLQINWNYDKATDTGDIKYTNVVPNGAENGGYIYYGSDNAVDYDAFYDIYNKGADDLIEIEWNRAMHNGRVRNLNHFGNLDWHYWDSLLQDSVAP
jgi:hypothetical protein